MGNFEEAMALVRSGQKADNAAIVDTLGSFLVEVTPSRESRNTTDYERRQERHEQN